ncbi:transmembrane protein, putative [Medicago truncatula]|uniref:Transmembrane protein, putative n=1 Tax=Medicago truncatula TaxID=3880 RepID=A0A072UUP3_MEDTR|nr:transmembrane protein, putative [Medicago truncatula]
MGHKFILYRYRLSRRLNSWGNNYISFGGRIVLLNSVLNVIPIFYLSCFKMLVKVWKKVMRIQRGFLWEGVGGGKKISLVKWDIICTKKSKGGLGVRNVKMVNLSLLAKWKWRLIQGDHDLWEDVLVEKYGRNIINIAYGSSDTWPRWESKWWLDLVRLEEGEEHPWFNAVVARLVGNGMDTSFWKVAWQGFCSTHEVDRWSWGLESNSGFSVKSLYTKLELLMLGENGCSKGEMRVFRQIWKSGAPSKVVNFEWKLLHDRIPTRVRSSAGCVWVAAAFPLLPVSLAACFCWCGRSYSPSVCIVFWGQWGYGAEF